MREVAAVKQVAFGFLTRFLIILAVLLMLYSLIFPTQAAASVRQALSLLAGAVVPSLFLFIVCARLLVSSGAASGVFAPLLSRLGRLFGVSVSGMTALLIGLVSGFPMGAVALADMVRRSEISKKEASFLLPFCNNAGAAFVIGTVGALFFHSSALGGILFAAQTASAVTGLLFTAKKRKIPPLPQKAVTPAAPPSAVRLLTASVSGSIASLLAICGYVIFFSVLSDVVTPLFAHLQPPYDGVLSAVFSGILEISGGLHALSKTALPYHLTLSLAAALLGFGGLSVLMQVADAAESAALPLSHYLIRRVAAALLCAAYALLFDLLFHRPALIFVGIPVLFSVWLLRFIKNRVFLQKRGGKKTESMIE